MGAQGSHAPSPHFNFQTKQGPTVSVSNVGDTTFYGCSEITRNFTIFIPCMLQFLDNSLTFFLTEGKESGNILIVDHPKDHNERGFKR